MPAIGLPGDSMYTTRAGLSMRLNCRMTSGIQGESLSFRIRPLMTSENDAIRGFPTTPAWAKYRCAGSGRFARSASAMIPRPASAPYRAGSAFTASTSRYASFSRLEQDANVNGTATETEIAAAIASPREIAMLCAIAGLRATGLPLPPGWPEFFLTAFIDKLLPKRFSSIFREVNP